MTPHHIPTQALHCKVTALLQSAYTLRGAGKWIFSEGHLVQLLFLAPEPAFHPAPGKDGDG